MATGSPLRPADDLLVPAVAETLQQLPLADEDVALSRLALTYAAAIDDARGEGDALEKLGPKLQTTLESLGASPKARAAVSRGVSPGAGRLASLRAARAG